MKRVCKIRFYPNQTQKVKINNILGCCRYVSNLYIEYNQERYTKTGEYITGYEFSRIITKLKKNEPRFMWLNEISTKAIKDSIMNTEKAFKKFFRKTAGYPKFKSRKRLKNESFFFIRDNISFETYEKNIIRIPILGKIRITERKYLPSISQVSSGRVIKENNKYYVMFIYNINSASIKLNSFGIGCDIGIKIYLTMFDGVNIVSFRHFKEYENYKYIQQKIARLQQLLSKKVEYNYGRLLNQYFDKHHSEPNEKQKNIMKGESYCTSGVRKLRRKINKLYEKGRNIRKDYIDKLVYKLVARIKPSFITIEDLSISNMIEGEGQHNLHRYISESSFYYFRTHLFSKIEEFGNSIELRIANKYFASSKKCSNCGNKLKTLRLSDRVYRCPECGLEIDRDVNAAINLHDLSKYTIA